MSKEFAKAIDEGIFGQLMDFIVKEKALGVPFVAGKALAACNAVAEGVGNACSSIGGVAVASMALGSSAFGREPSPPEVAKSPSQEISAPTVSCTKDHHVSMDQLGTLSPSTPGGCSRGGAGIGI